MYEWVGGITDGSLVAGEFVDEGLLFGLDLDEAVVLDGVSFEFCLLLVEEVVEFHHLALPVLGLALPLVAFAECAQLLLLDLHCEVVEALGQRGHRLVHRDHLGNELHRQPLQVVRLPELLGVQHADVVLLVEGYRQLLRHLSYIILNLIQSTARTQGGHTAGSRQGRRIWHFWRLKSGGTAFL